MKLKKTLIVSTFIFSGMTQFLNALDCPDLSYAVLKEQAPALSAVKNLAIGNTSLVDLNALKELKGSSKIKDLVTLDGNKYSIQNVIFATTRYDQPKDIGEYFQSKGTDYALKGHKKDGKCVYFLSTVLEIDLKAE